MDDVAEYTFFEGNIFYVDHANKTFSIYQKDLITGQIKLFRGDGISKRYLPPKDFNNSVWYNNVISTKEHLYCTTRGPAKLIQLKESGYDVLVEDFSNIDHAEYLIVATNQNKLYYVLDDISLKGQLFIYNVQNNENQKIKTLNNVHDALGIKVIGGHVFYYRADDKSLVCFPI